MKLLFVVACLFLSVVNGEGDLLNRLILRALDERGKAGPSSGDKGANKQIEEAIHGQEEKYMKYFREQTYDKLAALYTDNGSYYTPRNKAVHGSKNIAEKVWNPAFEGEPGTAILQFRSDSVINAGDNYAIGHGDWVVYAVEKDERTVAATGHFVTVYKKVKGEWLIEVDMINEGPIEGVGSDDDDDDDDDENDLERRAGRLLVTVLKRTVAKTNNVGLKDRLGI